MARIDLRSGEFVQINDSDSGLTLTIGDADGLSSAQIADLDELDDVIYLLANNEAPEADDG